MADFCSGAGITEPAVGVGVGSVAATGSAALPFVTSPEIGVETTFWGLI